MFFSCIQAGFKHPSVHARLCSNTLIEYVTQMHHHFNNDLIDLLRLLLAQLLSRFQRVEVVRPFLQPNLAFLIIAVEIVSAFDTLAGMT